MRWPSTTAAIEGALRFAGVGSGPRPDLTVDDPIMAGAPPTSGYAADPVCTATGHFVEREVDLAVPAHVAMTGWVRTYSSRWLEPGPFGRGWASWASVRLEAVDGGAVVVLPDGRRARFVGDGSGRPVRVTGLCADLVAGEDGWQLCWFDQDRWSFDRDGRLAAVASPGRGTATFHGRLGRLERIAHPGGRSVSLEWSGRRVGAVRASDGRVVRYRYDGAGDLVEVVGRRSWPAALRGRRRPRAGGHRCRRGGARPQRVRPRGPGARAALAVRSADHLPLSRVGGSRWSRTTKVDRPSPICTTGPGGSSVWWTTTARASRRCTTAGATRPRRPTGPARSSASCGTSGAGCCGVRNPTVR